MDVLLLTASGSLGVWLPKPKTLESSRSVKMALVLSLTLLSLSFLEAVPSHWMVLLEQTSIKADTNYVVLNRNDNSSGGGGVSALLSITGAYQIVLWIVCGWIVVVLPGHIGGKILNDTEKWGKRKLDVWDITSLLSAMPWWIRYAHSFVSAVLCLLYRMMLGPAIRFVRRKLWRKSSDPILLLTSNHNGSRHGSKLGTKLTEGASSVATTPPSVSVGSPSYSKRAQRMRLDMYFTRSYFVGACGGILVAMIFLRTLGPMFIEVHSRGSHVHFADGVSYDEESLVTQSSETQILSTLVSWLCAVGLVISSMLNGFGCVSMPHSCLAGWSLETVKPDSIAKAEHEYRETERSMGAKQEALRTDSTLLPSTVSSRRSTTGSTASSLTSSLFRTKSKPVGKTGGAAFSDLGESSHNRRQILQKEIRFLENLLAEMRVDISEMKDSYETALRARTPVGRFKRYVGFVFSIVLLIRLGTAVLSIVRGSLSSTSKQSDPITLALLWLTGHDLVSQEDYDKISQGVSLILTAVLSVSQVRTFLRTAALVSGRLGLFVNRCYTHNSTYEGSNAGNTGSLSTPSKEQRPKSFVHAVYETIYAYVLAAVMGCYFVSCVVLTKMSLPIEYRSAFAAALGGMDFTIRSSAIHLVFVLSTAVSAAILGILLGIQRQNTKRYAQDSMSIHGGGVPPC